MKAHTKKDFSMYNVTQAALETRIAMLDFGVYIFILFIIICIFLMILYLTRS